MKDPIMTSENDAPAEMPGVEEIHAALPQPYGRGSRV